MSASSTPDRRRWRAPLLAAAAGGVAYGASLLLRRAPDATEALYAQGLAPWIAAALSGLTGLVPFSLAEVVLVLYVAWMATHGLRGLVGVARRRQRLGLVLQGGAQRILLHGGTLLVAFYLLWGFNYARAPLGDRLGWPAWEGAEIEEVTRLAEESVRAANDAYRALHGRDDAGAPTQFPEDASILEAALAEGWDAASAHLGVPIHGAPRVRTKRPLFSGAMARLGISGIYFPFTAEPHVIRGLPAVSAVQGMAHEKAHQRGVAIEAEAGFMGFVAGALAPDALARYSAAVFASRRLLAALAPLAPDVYARLNAEYVPGIRRDLEEVRAFWARYQGMGRTIGTAVNHRYLRANHVPGGVASYGFSVRLLIEHARQAGTLLPNPVAPHASAGR